MAYRNKSNSQSKNKANSNYKFFKDERFKITLGLIILACSFLLLLAEISYLFTWKADQSLEWGKVWSSPDIKAENWSGKLGAYFANLFINRWFGIASLSFPFILFLFGLKLLKVKILPFGKSLRLTIIITILLSITLGFLFRQFGGVFGSGFGGRHGLYLSEWLIAFIGNTGTAIILFITILTFITFSFKNSVKIINEVLNKLFLLIKSMIYGSDNVIKETISDKKSGSEEELIFETDFPHDVDDESKEIINDDEEIIEDNDEIELTVETKKENEEYFSDKSVELENYDPTLDLSKFKMPPLDLLEKYDASDTTVTNEELVSNKNKIVETLGHYKIQINKIKATIGPTVTLYEIVPAPGVRISRIRNLEDDIALSLSALGIRIIAPIPGKGTIGIEVPNQKPEIVSMRSLLASRNFQENNFELPVAIGKTISNEAYTFDLTKMPHLLVAGATGQGKSVGLNVIITSLLYKKHPSELKFVFIDPKKVELTLYSKIEKHYLATLPDKEEAIITDIRDVIYALNSLTIEMDSRYELLKKAHVRNIKEYNTRFINRQLNPEKGHRFMPYIVLVIDEFADLIMTAGREVETPLTRLAQLARAIGIHLVIATQRPTTNIITGTIKANFPARIAFRVTAMIDSRTILDTPGANQLVGRGDMLFAPGSDMIRLQCGFIDIPELERITKFIGSQQGYPTAMYLPEYISDISAEIPGEVDLSKRDSMFNDAAKLVVIHQQGSTSLIQRKFSIGYNRAGRIIDQLEAAGIVGPYEGSKARHVLFPDEYSLEQYLKTLDE